MPHLTPHDPQNRSTREFYGIIKRNRNRLRKPKEKVMYSMDNPTPLHSLDQGRLFRLLQTAFIALLLCLTMRPTAMAAQRGPALEPKYTEWLELVNYIITGEERKVFLQLTNDRDRDAFISIFWSQRDPTKGTPENEFKDEHIKRFQYANRYYGFTSPLPGWKTDRGRIHIILGPPVSRNEVFSSYLYPIEIWEYYGDPKKGMPTMFHIVFYRKGGSGDFKLYVPAQDGPDQLLVKQIGEFASNDYQSIYEAILDRSPQVAEIALTLIPGEKTVNYAPSMRDLTLMSQVAEYPKKNLNTTYASQFLNYKSFVNVEDSFDYLSNHHQTVILRDPVLGMNFVHFAVWPERISVDYSPESDKYYCDYKMVVDLKQNGRSVFQYTKNLPFSYSKQELDSALANGLILADCFPVIDGQFDMTVFVQNAVNREFSFFDKKLEILPQNPGQWAIYGPIVSYRIVREPSTTHTAFTLLDIHVSPDPQFTFGQQEPLQAMFCVDRGKSTETPLVEVAVTSLPGAATPYSHTVPDQAIGAASLQAFIAPLDLLPPGNYQLDVRVRDATGVARLTGEAQFTVSTLLRLGHPPVAAPTLASARSYVYEGMLASQYEKCGRAAEAEQTYRKALAATPGNAALLKNFVGFLLDQKRYDQVLEAAAPLQNAPETLFEFHALRGKALYHLGRYTEAVDELVKANGTYDSDAAVLNTLGLSLLRLNNPAEARRALEASLKINPKQPDVADLLKKLDAPNPGSPK
jgi:GWxTD domain-containing protein